MLAVILTFGLRQGFGGQAAADDQPPPDLLRRVAERESENETARNNYIYRQTVVVQDLDKNGGRLGEFREVREIIFSPQGTRSEQVVEKPMNTLVRLKMTDEDLRDMREIQPLLITKENAFLYESKFQGSEEAGGVDCWILRIRPRQIFSGNRYFDGLIWAAKSDASVVKLEGQAVPQIETTKDQNLFARFTTIRERVDGKYWFPVQTYSDDTLYFRSGPQRIRMTIRYANYRRFSAETKIEYK